MRMPPVNWLRRICALVLLALWVPATSHCAVETVLEWAADEHCVAACSHDASASADHVANDACATLEGGAIKAQLGQLVAPAPIYTVLACLACVHAALLADAEPLAPASWSGEHPREWMPVRHIAVRAVAPARAPNLI